LQAALKNELQKQAEAEAEKKRLRKSKKMWNISLMIFRRLNVASGNSTNFIQL
jgi:hypothetical protein